MRRPYRAVQEASVPFMAWHVMRDDDVVSKRGLGHDDAVVLAERLNIIAAREQGEEA